MIALQTTLTPNVFDDILCFLDDASHVAVNGQGTNDIANMADLDGFVDGPFARVNNFRLQLAHLYKESMTRWTFY